MKHICGSYYNMERLLKRDKKRCCGCGMKHQQHGQNLEADHVYSKAQLRAEGREDEISFTKKNLHNFQLLCRRCNVSKREVCFDARYRLKNFKGRITMSGGHFIEDHFKKNGLENEPYIKEILIENKVLTSKEFSNLFTSKPSNENT